MAISDILVAIIFSYHNICPLLGLPYLWDLLDNEVFANILCKAYFFFSHTSMFVTLTTLLIISVERFRSTKLTVHRVRPYTLRKRLALVSCSWLLPMGLSAYKATYFKIVKRGNTNVCYVNVSMTTLFLCSFSKVFALLVMCLVVIAELPRGPKARASGAPYLRKNGNPSSWFFMAWLRHSIFHTYIRPSVYHSPQGTRLIWKRTLHREYINKQRSWTHNKHFYGSRSNLPEFRCFFLANNGIFLLILFVSDRQIKENFLSIVLIFLYII